MASARSFSFDGISGRDTMATARAPARRVQYDLTVGYADPDTLPLDGLAEALKTTLEREGRDLARYPHSAGLPALRQLVAEKLASDRGMKVTANDVLLTAGATEAIALVIQALVEPGDVVLTEEFLYAGTLYQLRQFGAEVVGVPCDDQGLVPEELEAALKRLTGQGKRVKFLYTIPSFQNPLGWTLPLERRRKVLEVAGAYEVAILEDDCLEDLRFEGERVTSFHALDDSGRVLYVNSFSKVLGPGLRVGYLAAPPEVLKQAMSFKRGSVSQFTTLAVEEYLKHHLRQHEARRNQALRVKRDAMLASLGEHMGNAAAWNRPLGGMFVWLKLPEGADLASLQPQAADEGVGYLNGTVFSPEGRGANCARLCYSYLPAQDVYDGVAELARILERHGLIGG